MKVYEEDKENDEKEEEEENDKNDKNLNLKKISAHSLVHLVDQNKLGM